MGLEILAGRLVAPTFGGSVYTWGSVIGIFLAALSLGYHHGGRRASRHASRDRLALVLALATVFVAVPILVGDSLLAASISVPLPARYLPLIPVAILFGPPVYLLGFVSPYAAELSRLDGTGAASGRVYAVGTVGSIAGAFGTTFVLLPVLHVEAVAVLLGGLLLGGAVVVSRRTVPQVAGLTLATIVLLSAAGAGLYGLPGEDVVYRTGTPYQQLEVIDEGDVRTLYLDGHPHSAMDLDDPYRHVFAYTRYFHLPFLLAEEKAAIDRVLFIGGGGFTGPRVFTHLYDVTVDVVELDPTVVRVAKEYFRVNESGDLTIHVGPGRRYLTQTNQTYDLIVVDAYRKARVPFQLTTVEFMNLAKQRLSPTGFLLANVISAARGPGSKFFRAEYRTMAHVFSHVYAFPTQPGAGVQNIEIIASRSPRRVTRAQLRHRNRHRDIGVNLTTAVDNYRADIPVNDVPLLWDDHAPVDRLLRSNVGETYVLNRTTETAAA